jgi:hypothetical protein
MPGPVVSGSASIRMSYKAPPVEGRFVDESLFGDTAAQAAFKSKSYGALEKGGADDVRMGATAAAVARDTMRGKTTAAAATTARKGGKGAIPPAPVILTTADVIAMGRMALLRDPVAERAAKVAAEDARYEREAVAEERKAKIRGMEAARLAALPLSQLQMEAEAEKAARRVLAAAQCEDATDDMKRMNSMLNQAITVAIRDRQVAEKRDARVAEGAAERLRELAAEVENLEAQQKADAALGLKKERLAVVRDELGAQLAEALARKKAARAAIALEEIGRRAGNTGEMAVEAAEKAKKEVKRCAQLADFKADNEAQVVLRKARKDAEAAQDAKADAEALAVLATKIAHAALVEKAAAEKERTLHLAATNVAKILDNSSARDEARQRREEELGARRERAKAVAKVAKEAATAIELREAHYSMAAEKQTRAASMIEDERAEFERAAVVQKEWLAAERRAVAAKGEKNAQLLLDLRGQMNEKEQLAKAARVVGAREEAQRVATLSADLAKRVLMRDKKVGELRDLGVDPRWANQLASMTFSTVDKFSK